MARLGTALLLKLGPVETPQGFLTWLSGKGNAGILQALRMCRGIRSVKGTVPRFRQSIPNLRCVPIVRNRATLLPLLQLFCVTGAHSGKALGFAPMS